MKKHLAALAALALCSLAAAAPAQETFDLQAAIDRAQPGEVVAVPAGAYRGNFKLKDGVVLSGAGAAATVLDGNLNGPVIDGAEGAIVQGFRITRGVEGVKTNGHLMGIFNCIVAGNAGVGICTGGGDAVLVNNVVRDNQGKAGIEAARSYILAANNTICGNPAGVMFWNAPSATIVNNILALNGTGLLLQDSTPEIDNNGFWSNGRDFDPAPANGRCLYDDPLFADLARRDFSLSESSPLRTLGAPVEGLPAALTASVGADLSFAVDPALGRSLVESVRSRRGAAASSIVYELSDRVGSFLVTVKSSRPAFKITSSAAATAIDQVSAFDSVSDEDLLNRLTGETPAAVDIWGLNGKSYVEEDGRYVMEAVFSDPAAYFQDAAGDLHFVRSTNLGHVAVAIPEGCSVASASPPGAVDLEKGLVSFENPKGETIEISLVFSGL